MQWGVLAGLDSAAFDTQVDSWRTSGYVPRETRIRINSAGLARYNTLFGKLRANEQVRFEHRLTQAGLDSLYGTYVVNLGWRVEDFFPYQENGTQYYAVLFSSDDTNVRWLRYGLSEAQAASEIAALPGQGKHVDNIVADPTYSPPRFAFTANDVSGCVPHVYINDALSQYQTIYNSESAKGYRLQKLQIYNNGTTFTALFDRAPGLFGICQ